MKKLPQFTGRIGNGPGFAEFLVRLTVTLREKDLHSVTRNVIAENAENIVRPIAIGASATITKEAYQKDRSLTAILMNALTGDAFAYATQKFPITEHTKDEDFIGLRLYMGLKAKYDVASIRSEIFKKKQEIINFRLNGNMEVFLKEINNKRHYLLAHSKMTDGQITLFDEDVIQAILMKLPASYNAFIIAIRAIEQYSMTFTQFVSKIENEEREMQVQRHHPPQQKTKNKLL